MFPQLLSLLIAISPTEGEVAPAPNLKLEVPILITEFAAAYFVGTILHESAHVLTAKAIGVPMLHDTVYPTDECGSWGPGCVVVDGSGDDPYIYTKHLYTAVAGVISTRYTADFIDYVADRDFTSKRVDQGLAAMWFMMRMDLPQYVIYDAVQNWRDNPQDNGDDMQTVVRYMTTDSTRQKWIFAGLVTAVLVDIIVDWDSFKKNWRRLWLK